MLLSVRVVNVLRNSFYALCSFAIVALLGFIVRKEFVIYLQVELLGLEGLFSNIVNMLSLAEMGISTVISYGLYRELANKNKQEINLLMNIYRHIYFLIGCLVFIIGILLFFFLPYIVQDNSVSWYYVELIYCIQIITILTSYFLAYRQTLLTADQKDYISAQIGLKCSLVSNACKLIAIVYLQSYTIYALCALVSNVVCNAFVYRRVGKEYPFLCSMSVTLKEMKEKKIFHDVRNFLIHKVSYVIYGGTDAIVVSSILGLRLTGMLANYQLIQTGVYQVLYKVLQGIIPSIGNLVYDEDKKKVFRIYKMLDLFYFFIGGYVACIYVLELQPFITLFFGSDFLLPNAYVVALAVNVFLGMQFENAYNFRSTYGVYENDRGYMMASAAVNLILSIVLVYQVGIVGIMIGTIAGLVFILYGRVQFVFRLIFRQSMKGYLLGHLAKSILIVVEITVISMVINWIALPTSYCSIFLESILAAVLMGMMHYIVFHKNEEFQIGLGYLTNIKVIFLKKIGYTK